MAATMKKYGCRPWNGDRGWSGPMLGKQMSGDTDPQRMPGG